MTKAEYFERIQKNPWTFPGVEGFDAPPAEWVSEAWELETIQGSIAYDMARDVSKNGEIFCGPEYLGSLSEALTTDQVVRLFLKIREWSPHREREFRPQFEQGFARHASALPPPLTPREAAEALGLGGGVEDRNADMISGWFRKDRGRD
jgi:hypothetical protein